jgi:hypothetical protein
MPEPPDNAKPSPVTPMRYLQGWEFQIVCSRCRHLGSLTTAEVAERHGSDLRVHEVVRRLRCGGYRSDGQCRAAPSQVILAEVSRLGKSTRVVREIDVLVGNHLRRKAWAQPS